MLVINPDECIDCELCVPECPINAIWPEDEVPEEYAEWVEKNAELWEDGEQLSEKEDALDGAKDLGTLQAEERDKGWDIEEPSKSI